MITCPACNHQNIDGTQFCEMCGEELPDATAKTSMPTGSEVKCPNCGHLNPPENLACEACGADLKPAAQTLSPALSATPSFLPPAPATESTPFDSFIPSATSGALLMPPVVSTPIVSTPVVSTPIVSTPVVSTPVVSTPVVSTQTTGDLKPGSVKLVVEQRQSVGAQFILNDEQIEVGREDEDEEIFPDIDLSDQDAGYVHRRHATLRFDNGHLNVTHLGGANKTRVNNKPVGDNVPADVKLGDKIAFGKVVLRLLPV